MQTQFILYVENQERSTYFYKELLDKEPSLYVKGMTEFELNSETKLGLMPNDGIAKLFPSDVAHPKNGLGIPRCELYLKVADVTKNYKKALELGAKSISLPQKRDWGHFVAYVMDFNAHIIAFYSPIP